MKKSFLALAAAVTALSMICTACGVDKSAAEFTRKEQYEPVIAETEAVRTQADTETDTETAPAEEIATDTNTRATETKKAEEESEPPKPVKIKEGLTEGHSFSISDFPDKVYSNKKLKDAFDEIDGICADYGYNISFAYMNMDTGAVCKYNEYAQYGCCSTIKAPFCKALLDSGIDLDEEISVTAIWDMDGGKVASSGYGSTYTAKELIKLAVNRSDNSAYYNLVEHYGFETFNSMSYGLGSDLTLGYGYIFNYCDVNDLLADYVDIYKYAENSRRGEWLVKQMKNTDLDTQIAAQLGDKYTVAHKYGSDWDQLCFHDCAIVYADSPFVLCVMTAQEPETKQSCKVFKSLAKQFDTINSQLAT